METVDSLREKVIQGLECCSKDKDHCNECPYYSEEDCWQLERDALELLKEQEPVIQKVDMNNDFGKWTSVIDELPKEYDSEIVAFYGDGKLINTIWGTASNKVLVFVSFPNGTKKVTTVNLEDGKWRTTVSPLIPHTVTHWMPLPEPPQEI